MDWSKQTHLSFNIKQLNFAITKANVMCRSPGGGAKNVIEW